MSNAKPFTASPLRRGNIIPVLIFALFVFACGNKKPAVKITPFTLHNPDKVELTGYQFSPANGSNLPVLVLFDGSTGADQYWRKTAERISQSGYRVLLTTFWDIKSDSLSFISKHLTDPLSQRPVDAAIIGVGPAAESAVHMAAADTAVKAFVTFDAALNLTDDSIAKLRSIPPRPLLFIETTLTPQTPDANKLAVFEKAGDPKKIVWLATDKNYRDILNSDMEPIVRRTILLLTNRYLKGKS